MISVEELRAFLNTPDYPDSLLEDAIVLAERRLRNLLSLADTDPVPDTPEVKKAWLLLAASEVASQTNLYWRKGDNYEILNSKALTAEVERLLKLVPKGALKWTSKT